MTTNGWRVSYLNVIDHQRHVLMADLTREEASNLARNMTEEGLPKCRVEQDDLTPDGAVVA